VLTFNGLMPAILRITWTCLRVRYRLLASQVATCARYAS
jgi:hypothetical protein